MDNIVSNEFFRSYYLFIASLPVDLLLTIFDLQ